MEQRPEQRPEGKLIAAAADRMNLSIREAARRAGISYGRWRQIVTGYQNVSPGSYAEVRAPAKTLAKMALTVGIAPEQMEAEGQRPDAAGIMRQQESDRPGRPAFAPPPRNRRLKALEDSDEPGLVPYLAEVAAEVSRAMDEHGPDLTGAQAFPDRPVDQGYWDNPRLSGYERVRLVARMRRMSAEGGAGQRDRSVSGLAPWHETGADGAVPPAGYQAAVT